MYFQTRLKITFIIFHVIPQLRMKISVKIRLGNAAELLKL